MKNFDCVIIGGGMVGATTALSLANLGLNIAIVEQSRVEGFSSEQSFELRVSAISLASQHLLSQVNAWQQITHWRYCPYKRLGVWEDPIAYTEFTAEDIEEKYLGYIVENRLIQLSLWQQIEKNSRISLFCPDSVKGFSQNSTTVTIELGEQNITAKVLIAADGANSKVRALAGIGITGWDYQQSAMLINVETSLSQQDITWQQFTATGPVAMLPMPGESKLGGNASLVWYNTKDEIKRLSALDNNKLRDEILMNFPERLGNINVIDKASFPLTRRHANNYQQGRVLLLGDAAHTINPMAGQGVNIGFKDVKALQEVIASAIGAGECWHNPQILSRYEKLRRKDNLLMMSTMDLLYKGFNHPSPIVKLVRNTGLFMANKSPFLKNKALAYACGL